MPTTLKIRSSRHAAANRTRPSTRVLLAALLCVAGVAHAQPEYFIVGDTAGGASHCEYPTIQSALDAARANGPDLDYVLVTNTASYAGQALVVGDQSVLIEGGYADCDITETGTAAVIVGDGAHSVIDIQTPTPGRSITLRHLSLSGGNASAAGGGVRVSGSAYVMIESVSIHDNRATLGGGIASVGAVLLIGKDVAIFGNTARRLGGGMYLQGGTVRIENDRTIVNGNRAQFDINNLPSGQGGGIYATNVSGGTLDVSVGAWQYEVGDPRPPITGFLIVSNRADDAGGGIYMEGPNVQFITFETSLVGNSAANGGGGVKIRNGGSLQMSRDFPVAPPSPQCAEHLQCNLIIGNNVDPHGNYTASGGGILVQVGTVRLIQTAVLDNVADAASAIGTGNITGAQLPYNTVRLQGVLASGNHCRHTSPFSPCSTVDLIAGTDARITYTTIAGNTHATGSSATEIYAYGAGTTLRLLSSIAVSTVPILNYGGGGTYQADCVISNFGMPPGSTRSQVATPGFNNASAYDYRLRSTSLATDFCDNANTGNDDFRDLTLIARGFDDTRHTDLHGRFDVGAFESDHIFGSGLD